MILLTDEEKKVAIKIFKWLREPCPHGIGDFHDKDEPVTMCYRHACGQCIDEAEKELGI